MAKIVRLVGVDLPPNKKLAFALTYIYGIGNTASRKIIAACKLDPEMRTDDLSEGDINNLREEIEANHQVEGDLRRKEGLDIKRLIEINCYRGTRHKRGLPARGQRTKTNSRTRRATGSRMKKK